MTTQAQLTQSIAHAVRLASGKCGYNAMLLARSTLANALAFDYVRAMNTTRHERPVADAHLDEELRAILGDVAPQQAPTLDADAIMDAHAKAYLALVHAVNTPDPETGRRPEWMLQPSPTTGRRRVESLPDAVVAIVDSNTARNIERCKVQATSLAEYNAHGRLVRAVDTTARIAALKAEGDARAAELKASVAAGWLLAVKEYRDADVDELLIGAAEQIAANGRDPSDEIRRAAEAMQKKARERFEQGKFAAIPADILALIITPTE